MKHSQCAARVARGGVRCLKKPCVPSSMPCILYALFTLLILTRLISLTAHHKSLLVAKKYKNLWGCRPVSHTAHHVFVDLIFLLEFLICKRVKVCSHRSLMHSHQRVVRFYKGTVRRPSDATSRCATRCYVMLRDAMHAQCSGRYDNALGGGGEFSIQRSVCLVCLSGAPAECTQPELIQQVHQKQF